MSRRQCSALEKVSGTVERNAERGWSRMRNSREQRLEDPIVNLITERVLSVDGANSSKSDGRVKTKSVSTTTATKKAKF